MVIKAVLAIFMIQAAYTDIKKKEVNLILCLAFMLIALCINGINLVRGLVKMNEILLSVVPGVLLLIISKITNQSIGVGDSVVAVVIGLLIGFEKTVVVLMIGFMVSAFISILLMVFKKVNKNHELPFVPILFLATILATSIT